MARPSLHSQDKTVQSTVGSSGCLPCLLDTICSSSHTPRETEAWGLLRDRMSSCDPTYLGIKATGQVGRVGGCGGGGSPEGRSQGGGGSRVPRQGVVWKSVVGRVMEGTMPSGLGWRGQRKGLLSPLGSHGASPNLLCLHPHSPGSAPQLDGNAFSASMAPRATCSAWLGRWLVLLTPSPRVARLAEGRGVGRPRRRRATTGFR